jgi:hypothetical protein
MRDGTFESRRHHVGYAMPLPTQHPPPRLPSGDDGGAALPLLAQPQYMRQMSSGIFLYK